LASLKFDFDAGLAVVEAAVVVAAGLAVVEAAVVVAAGLAVVEAAVVVAAGLAAVLACLALSKAAPNFAPPSVALVAFA
jgi:hypothetical protein